MTWYNIYILSPSSSASSTYVFCYNFCPTQHSLPLALHIIILRLVFYMLRQGYCSLIKHLFNRVTLVLQLHTCLQSTDYILRITDSP